MNCFHYSVQVIYETLQTHIQKPFKYLRWSSFAKTVNGRKPVEYFYKNLHLKYLNGLCIRLCIVLEASLESEPAPFS